MKYRRKTRNRVSEAVQWRDDNYAQVAAWVRKHYPTWSAFPATPGTINMLITPPEYAADWAVRENWWLVENGKEICRVSAKDFAEAYEPVEPLGVGFVCPICQQVNTYYDGGWTYFCDHQLRNKAEYDPETLMPSKAVFVQRHEAVPLFRDLHGLNLEVVEQFPDGEAGLGMAVNVLSAGQMVLGFYMGRGDLPRLFRQTEDKTGIEALALEDPEATWNRVMAVIEFKLYQDFMEVRIRE